MNTVTNVLREQLEKTMVPNSSLLRGSQGFNEERICKLLNSSSIRDKAEGLRELLNKVSEGYNAQKFFAEVVKTIHENDLEVREMSAAFLIMYAQYEPELTLMIVNSVQKMLGDSSAVVRMQALRLASALRVPTIAPLVAHLIAGVVNDVSPLVRTACFQAIGKCYELDSSLGSHLLDLLIDMLSHPKQTTGHFEVAGWGLAIIELHWPQRLDLLHPFFRIYVPHINEFDEWCQILICRMLVRYCRHYMTGPGDEDNVLLVNSVKPLLLSLNNAVVVEAAAVIIYLGTDEFEELRVAERLLSMEKSALLWSSIFTFCQEKPESFNRHRAQIIGSLLSLNTQSLRIQTLSVITQCNQTELTKYELRNLKLCAVAWQNDVPSLKAVMNAIMVLVGPSLVNSTLKWLLKLAVDKRQLPEMISEALVCLRILAQQHQIENISPLLRTLGNLVSSVQLLPSAKATIMWLMGVNCIEEPNTCSEVLRTLLKSFTWEPEEVRLQTLQLAAKLNTAFQNDSTRFDKRVPQFFKYTIMLALYDQNIDIRDRARFFKSLATESDNNNMATLLLEAVKPMPIANGGKQSQSKFLIDTTSEHFRKAMDGYTSLENWGSEDTSMLRDVKLSSEVIPSTESSKFNGTDRVSSVKNSESQSIKKMSFQEFLDSDENQNRAHKPYRDDCDDINGQNSNAYDDYINKSNDEDDVDK